MSKFMRSLCKKAIPVTLQSMLQASFSIVDQVMIGQLGETNISAVGLCGNFSLIFGGDRCCEYCCGNFDSTVHWSSAHIGIAHSSGRSLHRFV